ncbi:MAG: DUF177 domain-containing protein [Acidimicrobiales bacterium]
MESPRPTRHLLVNVTELRRRLGERMTLDIDAVLPPLGVISSRFRHEEPVTGSVVVDSIERGVTVLGEVSFGWEGECRRCLDDVRGETTAPIDEIFQVQAPDDSDIIDFDGEQIDLLPLVRDAVLVGLPLAPLCRDDCAGPDPERYPAVTADEWERQLAEKAAEPPAPDPRWAALSDIELD